MSGVCVGGGGGGEVVTIVKHVRHLVRIWGELQHFDNKIFHQARVSASQDSLVCVRQMILCIGKILQDFSFLMIPQLFH